MNMYVMSFSIQEAKELDLIGIQRNIAGMIFPFTVNAIILSFKSVLAKMSKSEYIDSVIISLFNSLYVQ